MIRLRNSTTSSQNLMKIWMIRSVNRSLCIWNTLLKVNLRGKILLRITTTLSTKPPKITLTNSTRNLKKWEKSWVRGKKKSKKKLRARLWVIWKQSMVFHISMKVRMPATPPPCPKYQQPQEMASIHPRKKESLTMKIYNRSWKIMPAKSKNNLRHLMISYWVFWKSLSIKQSKK